MSEDSRWRLAKEISLIEKILKKSGVKCEKLGVWCLYPEAVNIFKENIFAVAGRHQHLEKYPILFWHDSELQADYNAKVVRLLGGEAKVVSKKEALELLRKESILENSIKSFLEGGEIVE